MANIRTRFGQAMLTLLLAALSTGCSTLGGAKECEKYCQDLGLICAGKTVSGNYHECR